MPWKRILLEGDAAVLSDTAPVDVDHGPASAGTATQAARQDHKHDLNEGVVGTIASVDGSAAALGTDNAVPHLDHVHPLGPLVGNLDFDYNEALDLSLETRADLTAPPTGAAIKEGRIGFYTYDDHPYVYVA